MQYLYTSSINIFVTAVHSNTSSTQTCSVHAYKKKIPLANAAVGFNNSKVNASISSGDSILSSPLKTQILDIV